MADHPNSFIRRPVPTVDLSRLPAHIRTAVNTSVPFREGEVVGRVQTYRRTVNIPGARIAAQRLPRSSARPDEVEKVIIKLLDYQGVDPLGQIELELDAVQQLARHLAELSGLTLPTGESNP